MSEYNDCKMLDVTIHRASKLKDVERFGWNDPYVRLFLHHSDPDKAAYRTHTIQNGGRSPVWNATLTLDHMTENTKNLYVEILDFEKKRADRLIGFTAIPLQQVRMHNVNHRHTAIYDVFDSDGKAHGTITITLCIRLDDEWQPESIKFDEKKHMAKGMALIEEEHWARINSITGKVPQAARNDVTVFHEHQAFTGPPDVVAKYIEAEKAKQTNGTQMAVHEI
ncbi:Extended synaptotagmin-1 [Actinomortierella ambigua]|nr:Extended synaptotagmin-1 [Actinomortierella ambigua]